MKKKILPLLLLLLLLLLSTIGTYAQLLQERSYKIRPNYTRIVASAPAGQGNILYSGISAISTDSYDQYFLMVNPNGDTIWTKKGAFTLESEAHTLRAFSDGKGFIFGANIKNSSSVALAIQRINPDGSTAFTKNYAPTFSYAYDILLLPGKDYLLGGAYIQNKLSFMRTDSLGNIKWQKNSRWSNTIDNVEKMEFTNNGNIIVVGAVDKPVTPLHLKLLLLSQNGDSLLGKQLIVNTFAFPEGMFTGYGSVTPLSNDGFVLTAFTDTSYASSLRSRGMVVKVDANLNLVWKYIHRTPAVDGYIFTKSKELTDGSLLVLGFKMFPSGNSFGLYHFSPFGQLIHAYPFTSTICGEIEAITLDAVNDSIFLVGGKCRNFNPNNSAGMYIARVKVNGLAPVVSATKPELALQPTTLGQSYPNPAQDQALIPYRLPSGTKAAKIRLTDITGREVGSYPLKAQQKQGSLPVNLSRLRNGLYLYSLVVNGRLVATKKLAVAR